MIEENGKVRVNLIRRDNPDRLSDSFTIEMKPEETLVEALSRAPSDIYMEDLEFCKVEIELVEE